MVACEKSAQLIYEQQPAAAGSAVRAVDGSGQGPIASPRMQHSNRNCARIPAVFERDDRHPSIFAAIAWQFSYSMLAHELPAGSYPGLVQHSARMERSAQFRKYPPDGPGVPGPGASDSA